jgi:RNA polymerase sigma-70 factor (ECF subfamily)
MTDPASEPKPVVRAPALDFQRLYRAEFSYVIHTLRRLGVRDAALEDVAQDVFVAIYKHLTDYDPSRPLRPWLFGFAFRIASDHRKLARHRHETGEAAPADAKEPRDPRPGPEEQLEDERKRQGLLMALDAMEAEKRDLVVMHDLEGMGVPEIAAMLDIPLNTAYSRLRLARVEFEKHLSKTLGGRRGE